MSNQLQSRYQLGPSEYANYVRSPFNKQLYDLSQVAQGKANPMGTMKIADGEGKMSGGLHHAAFIGSDGIVYWIADTSNPSLVATAVTNAAQVIAYDNGGPNLGSGVATLTNDGKVILTGCTTSGFRGDGSAGNAVESTPWTVPLPVAIKKIAIGSYCFALGVDGKIYHWGGSSQDPYWAQFICGAFTPGISSAAFLKPSVVNLPEPIVDISGGSTWAYAKGQSGKWYVWGYDSHYWGTTANSVTFYDNTSFLAPAGSIVKLVVGSQATYALNDKGQAFAWGDNTQGAIGNAQEGPTALKTGVAGNLELWVLKPTLINPTGVTFVNIWADISLIFYAIAEDTNGNLYTWGRNKYDVLGNGKTMTDDQNANKSNMLDVLIPTKITAFGDASGIQPGGITTTPPPVVTPPIQPAPRTVKSLQVVIFGDTVDIPLSSAKFIYSDGTAQ